MRIAGVLLAAGSSTRLGRPKQTVIFDGETLLDRTAHVAHQAGLSPVIVVIAPKTTYGDNLRQQGCVVTLNHDAHEGMASSICCGTRAAQSLDAEGVVLLACDQPALTADHVRALCADPQFICGSGYAGKVGIPAYFPASSFDRLLALKGDTGARELLRNAQSIHAEGLSFDIDNEEDIAQLNSKIKHDPWKE